MTKPKNMTPEQEVVWREKNREKSKKYSSKYREKNSHTDQYKEKKKTYRILYKEADAKRAKEYYRRKISDKNGLEHIRKSNLKRNEKFRKKIRENTELHEKKKEEDRIRMKFFYAKKRAERGEEYEWFMANLMAEAKDWNGEPLAAPVPIIELETRQQADAAP